jgi:hypothetical protein
MPWELVFLDLRNHAQLMLAVMAFHETNKGTITPVVGKEQPTYRVLATLRLPDGRSVPLDDALHVEHLDYRTIIGKVPTFMVQKTGAWKQAWDFRVSYAGGRVKAGDGTMAKVPPFDLGLTPQFPQSDPQPDAEGNRLTQRVPYDAAGSYGGCPVRGFGWSELIIDWWGKEKQDPWYTGGKLPSVPSRCGSQPADPPGGESGDLSPDPGPDPPPHVAVESCPAGAPGPATCSYDATAEAGVSGYGAQPRGWTATITRPGQNEPIVVTSHGGAEVYTCGLIHPGDHVELTTKEGSSALAGDPAVCT